MRSTQSWYLWTEFVCYLYFLSNLPKLWIPLLTTESNQGTERPGKRIQFNQHFLSTLGPGQCYSHKGTQLQFQACPKDLTGGPQCTITRTRQALNVFLGKRQDDNFRAHRITRCTRKSPFQGQLILANELRDPKIPGVFWHTTSSSASWPYAMVGVFYSKWPLSPYKFYIEQQF